MDLPMPGSPPSRVTEPATRPPPEHPVELADADGAGRPALALDIGDRQGPAGDEEGGTGRGRRRPLLDDGVPGAAARAAAGPLRALGATVGTAVGRSELRHRADPTERLGQTAVFQGRRRRRGAATARRATASRRAAPAAIGRRGSTRKALLDASSRTVWPSSGAQRARPPSRAGALVVISPGRRAVAWTFRRSPNRVRRPSGSRPRSMSPRAAVSSGRPGRSGRRRGRRCR